MKAFQRLIQKWINQIQRTFYKWWRYNFIIIKKNILKKYFESNSLFSSEKPYPDSSNLKSRFFYATERDVKHDVGVASLPIRRDVRRHDASCADRIDILKRTRDELVRKDDCILAVRRAFTAFMSSRAMRRPRLSYRAYEYLATRDKWLLL